MLIQLSATLGVDFFEYLGYVGQLYSAPTPFTPATTPPTLATAPPDLTSVLFDDDEMLEEENFDLIDF